MSTQYQIFASDDLVVELDERSSKFEISMEMRPGTFTHSADFDPPRSVMVESQTRLTPADLVAMAFEILKVASYNGDLQEMVAKYLASSGPHSYERGMAREIAQAHEEEL